jgi:hypothetical protein
MFADAAEGMMRHEDPPPDPAAVTRRGKKPGKAVECGCPVLWIGPER